VMSYEGEGGLRLQGAACRAPEPAASPAALGSIALPLLSTGALETRLGGPVPQGGEAPCLGWLDWAPLLSALLAAIAAGVSPEVCAAGFHQALAQGLADLAWRASGPCGSRTVALAGGCFQNRLLLETAVAALRARGFRSVWSEAVPCNDGGLALGQAWALWNGAETVAGARQAAGP
jgi:hydrogenase maturation protein HypF